MVSFELPTNSHFGRRKPSSTKSSPSVRDRPLLSIFSSNSSGQENSELLDDDPQKLVNSNLEDEGFRDLENGTNQNKANDFNHDKSGGSSESSSSSSQLNPMGHKRLVFSFFIFLVGACASGAFLFLGFRNAEDEQALLFETHASKFVKSFQDAWDDYEVFGLWIHESCRPSTEKSELAMEEQALGICSRTKFRELYEYIISRGLEFQSAQFMPNVTHAQRAVVEASSKAFYNQSYPHVNYRGFVGFFRDDQTGSVSVQPQEEKPFYFPVHYVEPVVGNEAAIDLDLYSSPTQHKTIESALGDFQPALSDRLRLVQETDPNAYSIILHHPGVPLSTRPENERSTTIALMVIRIPALIERAARLNSELPSKHVYLYDDTYSNNEEPVFLGASSVINQRGETAVRTLPESDLSSLSAKRMITLNLQINNRKWIVVVQSVSGTYEPESHYVIIGGVVILAASLALVLWFYTYFGRVKKLNRIKARAEAEKQAIIMKEARRQAIAERQLNEYIAHEVRNPLSSAIAALSFVKAATCEERRGNTSEDEERKNTIKDDLNIIEASLQFISDLLRNMLDMHRAAMKQMKIELKPTDLLKDVLQPVGAILFMRGNKVDVQLDCPDSIVVVTDPLRLKQVILNLAINSSKFVEQGFIRLKGSVVDGKVHVYVEDSGPGIPPDKRDRLFVKFQQSLDLLSQGTGIGLCLCKHLIELLNGDIRLDDNWNSGVEGCPGTRFVVDLNTPPVEEVTEREVDDTEGFSDAKIEFSTGDSAVSRTSTTTTSISQDYIQKHQYGTSEQRVPEELPENLTVLFTDDDMVLRKLFCRSIRKVAPTWKIHESSNGESSLLMVESQQFDIIFLDQFMASINKQLLGTETALALRSKGVESIICGLSANDVESTFLEQGADAFMFKPFPCQTNALKQELLRVIHSSDRKLPPSTTKVSATPEEEIADMKEE